MTYTKKDLEQLFGVADTTVYRTIKAAGLSTAQRTYTDEEVTLLARARELFDAGYTVRRVREYFMAQEIHMEVCDEKD